MLALRQQPYDYSVVRLTGPAESGPTISVTRVGEDIEPPAAISLWLVTLGPGDHYLATHHRQHRVTSYRLFLLTDDGDEVELCTGRPIRDAGPDYTKKVAQRNQRRVVRPMTQLAASAPSPVCRAADAKAGDLFREPIASRESDGRTGIWSTGPSSVGWRVRLAALPRLKSPTTPSGTSA